MGSPQMRVSAVLSIVFFLTSSLFLSTEALSSGFSLGKKEKEAKAEPAAKQAETEEEAPAKEEDDETEAPTEETTEAGDTTGTGSGGNKDKILELISKLKEMNKFLNEMVTYRDKEAGGGKGDKDDTTDEPDADAAGKTDEKEETEDEAAPEETDTRRKKRMKRRF